MGGKIRLAATTRSHLTVRAGLLGASFLTTVALGSSDPASSAPAALVSHSPRQVAPSPGTVPSPGTPRAAVVTPGWASRNWSGYAVGTTGPVNSVSGTWTVPWVLAPTKKRLRHRPMLSSDWVGIDGYNNSDLIQAGIEQDWTGGRNPQPFYQAWWEIMPTPEMAIDTVRVSPGDQITVTITDVAGALWTISLVNDTTSDCAPYCTFFTEQVYGGPAASAEWIHEAVTWNRHISRLPHDTNVTFDNATVNGAPIGLDMAESGVMVKRNKVISTPSVPDADGDGFVVAYGGSAPGPPDS